MNLKDIRQAYFLGIGGIGMSAIARYFHTSGIRVSGYDRTETTLTRELTSEGMEIHYDDRGSSLATTGLSTTDTLVILTPAIPKDHAEWRWLLSEGFHIMKRAQVLGLITDAYKTIGVAGTHGKTTTSTLIAHLLKQSHLDCAAFLGGISSNYQSNLLLHHTKHTVTAEQLMVVEADEFDRSFLTLHPSVGIITSTDADHLDIYGQHDALKQSFSDYAAQVSDLLIVKKEVELFDALSQREAHKIRSYSIAGTADFYADNIRITGDQYFFDLCTKDHCIHNLCLGIPGLHNVENAVAASAAVLSCGISEDELRTGLSSFAGVRRRFEYIVRMPQITYIDDYAHHPEELRAILSSVKQMYPTKKITAIFQPHLYTRTRDFAEGFSESLSLADELILLDIYPARELPIPGVTADLIFENVYSKVKTRCAMQEVLPLIENTRPELLLTLGAGDIDQLIGPLKTLLTRMYETGK